MPDLLLQTSLASVDADKLFTAIYYLFRFIAIHGVLGCITGVIFRL